MTVEWYKTVSPSPDVQRKGVMIVVNFAQHMYSTIFVPISVSVSELDMKKMKGKVKGGQRFCFSVMSSSSADISLRILVAVDTFSYYAVCKPR